MNYLTIAFAAVLALGGCAKKEKTGLHDVLVERFKDDQDLKDYKLDPSWVADCVVDEISSSLPGFAGDPRRPQFFDAYARFLSVKSEAEAEKSIEEFEKLFGSHSQARVAATSMTDSIMTCMGKDIQGADTDGHRVQEAPSAPPASAQQPAPAPAPAESAPETGERGRTQ